ncbi:GDSL family lipase, carbohydrate esterase family 16 protein [Rhodotorula toruloides]|uniref:GDSL family lipase, carbohydrate esterase family 16 protein n=1 Tax=Rhodotorula toruloides TaxID=5286 RepID=A0A511KP09_RHOTO|nr:GDSL family lipase, carbohydrate esterase family 16 protein [Rhodotorula toruloides]
MARIQGYCAPPTLAFFTLVLSLFSLVRTVRAALPTLGDINTLFILGDSYSATGFDPSKGYDQWAQWPDTFGSGPSWSMYMANSTRVPSALFDRTFSLAQGGTPLSPERSWPNFPKDGMKAEVDRWEKFFVNASTEGKGARPVWTGGRTLFVIWFGVNDFEIAGKMGNLELPVTDGTFVRLQEQVKRLYDLGARNFLFPNLSQFHRSPNIRMQSTPDFDAPAAYEAGYLRWNEKLKETAAELPLTLPDANVQVWDTWSWFGRVLDNAEDLGFKNSSTWCSAYSQLKWTYADSFDQEKSECGVRLSEYFWADQAHPTYAVHKYLADSFIETLSNPQDTLVIEFDPTRLLNPERRLGRRSAVATLDDRNRHPSAPSLRHQHLPCHSRRMRRVPKRWDVSWTAVDPETVGQA